MAKDSLLAQLEAAAAQEPLMFHPINERKRESLVSQQ